jgi:hypothetical protein
MRKFRITGTVAGTAFRRVAREMLKNIEYKVDVLVEFVLDALLIKYWDSNNAVEEEDW